MTLTIIGAAVAIVVLIGPQRCLITLLSLFAGRS